MGNECACGCFGRGGSPGSTDKIAPVRRASKAEVLVEDVSRVNDDKTASSSTTTTMTSGQGETIATKVKRNEDGANRHPVRMPKDVRKDKKPERDVFTRKGSPLDSARLTKKPKKKKKKQRQQQQQKENTYSDDVRMSLNVQKSKEDAGIVDHPYVGYPYYEDGECGPPKVLPIKPEKSMKEWCIWITKGFKGGKVYGWITDPWTNGLAFCAMMKRACPDKIDYAHLREHCGPLERLQTAFSVAELELGVKPILEPKLDILDMPRIEKISLLLYLSTLQPAVDKRLYELAMGSCS